MAKRRGKRTGKGITGLISLLIVIVLFIIGGGEAEPGKVTNTYLGDGEVYVHFIDVGQGSSTLIQTGDKGILIDAGEQDYGEYLVSYIKSAGVEELPYVVASHPHSDHIGGMLDVFDAFTVGEVIMPELSEKNIPTTRLYENFMNYIIDNDLDVSFPQVGETYSVDGVAVSIMGPVKQDKELNNMSLICRVDAMGTKVTVLGDAEKDELSSVYETVLGEWKSDILAMGHHGSSTSVYKPLLNTIDADVAVISCGKDNSYGHPHKEALSYIKNNNMTVYRTDYDGDVVFRIDSTGYEKVD